MTSRDLTYLFEPRSVAIIGASSNPKKLGGRPLRFMLERGFAGEIYPVTGGNAEVQGLHSHVRVCDIEREIDQAIIVLPAAQVEAAIADCIAKGVKCVQILSAGFAETGPEGQAAQDRIASAARAAGMRLTGPNALGALSPSNGFYGTFSAVPEALEVTAGNIGFATQSGAFGSCAYVTALRRGLGVSRVVATGNEADIDVAECIDYLADDPLTDVICASIEGCKDGRKLKSALRKAAGLHKPVIILKVGASEIGAHAAATHTGALAGDDRVFDTIFRECGALRASTIEDMIDIAYVAGTCGLPGQPSAAIVSVSGGIGVLMADAAAEAGLELPQLSQGTLARLSEILPFIQGNNPLDATGQAATNRTGIIGIGASILGAEPEVASVIFYLANSALSEELFAPTLDALIELKSGFPSRSVVCVMPADPPLRTRLEKAGIAVFEDPSRAVRAIGAAGQIRRLWQDLEPQTRVTPTRQALPDQLDEVSCKAYLALAGMPVPTETLCTSVQECVIAAGRIGYPVVAKIVSPDIIHKTEVGGVLLDLADPDAVRAAFADIMERAPRALPSARIDGVLIAPMLRQGLDTILGIHSDPVFGPMVMFGLGGIMVEVFGDVAMASAPISRAGARRLIREVKGTSLLDGYRGSAPLDTEALVEAIVRLGDIAASNSEISSIDINPFRVFESGAAVLDAVIVKTDNEISGEGND